MEAWDAELGVPPPEPPCQLQEEHVRRLLRLLELAAARGAFLMQEFQEVGEVYNRVRGCLEDS